MGASAIHSALASPQSEQGWMTTSRQVTAYGSGMGERNGISAGPDETVRAIGHPGGIWKISTASGQVYS